MIPSSPIAAHCTYTVYLPCSSVRRVPATLQMVLSHWLKEVEALGCRFVLVAADAGGVVGPLRSSLLSVQLAKLPIGLWIERLLCVCVAQRVGYEREGIELIVTLAGGDLGAAVDLAQETFLRTSFLSRPNVIAAAGAMLAERDVKRSVRDREKREREPPPPPPLRQPIDPGAIAHAPTPVPETRVLGKGLRCAICTLPPPCRHISGPGLLQLAKDRRAALPRDPKMPLCPSFAATGACEAMNDHGYCRCDHPSDLWDYRPAVKRCPMCTNPEPCGICPWLKLRRGVARVTSKAAAELAELKHRGERSSVTLARFRSLFNAEVEGLELLLEDNARWLNVAESAKGVPGRLRVASQMTDAHLTRPPCPTDAKEAKARLQALRRRWDLSRQKLGLWLEGRSARHLTKVVEATDKVMPPVVDKPRTNGVAQVASRRFMPSPLHLAGDRNGVADWDPPSSLPRESPLLEVNTAVLKMGLRGAGGSGLHGAEEKYESGAEEAQRLRRERQDQEKKDKTNAQRKGMSMFSK